MNWIWTANMLGLFEMRTKLRAKRRQPEFYKSFDEERLNWIEFAIDNNAGMIGITEIISLLQQLDEDDLQK